MRICYFLADINILKNCRCELFRVWLTSHVDFSGFLFPHGSVLYLVKGCGLADMMAACVCWMVSDYCCFTVCTYVAAVRNEFAVIYIAPWIYDYGSAYLSVWAVATVFSSLSW